MYACYIYLSLYAIYEFVYTSHTYTYTYVTYLTYMKYTQKHMLPVCIYTQVQKQFLSYPSNQQWSGKGTGFKSLVYIDKHTGTTFAGNANVTYPHIRKLLSLSSYVIHVHLSVTYTHFYICHLYRCPYAKDKVMHMYVHRTYVVYIRAILHMRCTCIYVHVLPTCSYTYVTYVHVTCVT